MTTDYLGQIRYFYIKEMDQRNEGKMHPCLCAGQKGEALEILPLSTSPCGEYAEAGLEQKGFYAIDRDSYPALNKGFYPISAKEFRASALKDTLSRATRKEIGLEFKRFQKLFGEG